MPTRGSTDSAIICSSTSWHNHWQSPVGRHRIFRYMYCTSNSQFKWLGTNKWGNLISIAQERLTRKSSYSLQRQAKGGASPTAKDTAMPMETKSPLTVLQQEIFLTSTVTTSRESIAEGGYDCSLHEDLKEKHPTRPQLLCEHAGAEQHCFLHIYGGGDKINHRKPASKTYTTRTRLYKLRTYEKTADKNITKLPVV